MNGEDKNNVNCVSNLYICFLVWWEIYIYVSDIITIPCVKQISPYMKQYILGPVSKTIHNQARLNPKPKCT